MVGEFIGLVIWREVPARHQAKTVRSLPREDGHRIAPDLNHSLPGHPRVPADQAVSTEVSPAAMSPLQTTRGQTADSSDARQRPAMKKICILTVLMASWLVIWISWKLHFWVVPGQTFHVHTWNFGGYDLEVWQRKAPGWTEGFSTALFVRSTNNRVWEAFTIGHEDGYSPAIRLYNRSSSVEVSLGNKRLGAFNLTQRTYLRSGQTSPIAEGTTDSPSNWWVSPSLPATP